MSQTFPHVRLTVNDAKIMEQEQFGQLISRYHSKLYYMALKILGDKDDAQDALQDVYTSAWHKRQLIYSSDSPEAYLVSMTKNCAITMLRRKSRVLKIDGSIISVEVSDENGIQRFENNDKLRFLLNRMKALPPDQYRVMLLRTVKGLENEEICEITGFSPENVRQLLSRARKNLKQLVNNQL